jgi:general secretion pathway protein L
MNVNVSRSLHPLRIRYAAPALAHLREFWSWWTGELLALLPQRARTAIAQRRQKLFIEAAPDKLSLALGTWANSRSVMDLPVEVRDKALGDVPRDAQQNILLMPTSKVLATSLKLPLATEENLREVLGFEMDQHTPFHADKVYYDYVVTARNAERQELEVDLVYAPRNEVDRYCKAVAAYGIDLDIVTSRGRDGYNLRAINLLPQEQRRRRRVVVHRLNLALAVSLSVLLAIAITVPVVQKNRAIEELEAKVQVAAEAAREGNQLRRDLEKMAAATRFLVEKKRAGIMAVQLVDEVSRILPDHTWVTRLDISETELQIQGQSEASSSLIAIIETSPYFRNASFRSPVVQVQGTDADRFHLSAEIVRSQEQ